jgi:nucleotide-binding universal stress UspA family protein
MPIDGRLPASGEPASNPLATGTVGRTPADRPDPAADPRHRVRRILLATDLSPASDPATTWALDAARALEAELLIVSVIDPDGGAVDRVGVAGSRPPRWDQRRDDRQAAAGRLVERSRAAGIRATFLVWTGDPGESIVDAAAAEAADMVVVGSHGRGRLGRLMLGSVSDHVARHAPCPVVVVRADAAAG